MAMVRMFVSEWQAFAVVGAGAMLLFLHGMVQLAA